MKRIRHLGLGVVMALALTGVVGASSASASYVVFDEYPAFVTATPKGSHSIFFGGGKEALCSPQPFQAAVEEPTESLTPLGMPDSSCTMAFEGSMTMKMNGCKFIYHPGAETSPGSFAGTFDIGPPACGPITLSGANCKRMFASQTGLATTFDNEGGAVRIGANASGLKYTVEGPLANCGSGVQSSTYVGDWVITAENEEGESIDAQVVRQLPVGLFLTGKGSEEPAAQPKFEAESYPVTIAGEQDPADNHVLTINKRPFDCEGVSFTGEAGSATSQVTLAAQYEQCQVAMFGESFGAEIDMNSCHYDLSVLNSGPPYTGDLDVACTTPGDAIEVRTYESVGQQEANESFCTYRISPQANLQAIGLQNVGSGSERGVAVDLNLTGIAYTKTQGGLVLCGSKSGSATYAGGTTLLGFE